MPREKVEVPAAEPVEPWRSFLRDLDAALKGSMELRCVGGFVVTQHYGIGRETADIDFLAAVAQSPDDDVESLAGLGSALHRRYRQFIRSVTGMSRRDGASDEPPTRRRVIPPA